MLIFRSFTRCDALLGHVFPMSQQGEVPQQPHRMDLRVDGIVGTWFTDVDERINNSVIQSSYLVMPQKHRSTTIRLKVENQNALPMTRSRLFCCIRLYQAVI